jgi:hypothetical protein
MRNDVQVAVAGLRVPSGNTVDSAVVEMGGGEGNLVELLAVHWHVESVQGGAAVLLVAGLSSNPEHELSPPADFIESMQDPAVYGRASWTGQLHTSGFDSQNGVVIPLYGLIRPRRQIMVFININDTTLTQFTGEVYYEPFTEPNRVDRERVNREFGKYRRS